MGLSVSLNTLNTYLDRFIPHTMGADRELRKQARLFLISHIFGPFIGNVIPIALYILDPNPRYEVAVLAVSITGFWIFPILLKSFGNYYPLAMISIQNLMFCILWSCFFYGGVASPTLAWIVLIPLLSFFYLGAAPRLRSVVLIMFAVNFSLFYALYRNFGHAPDMGLAALQGLGLISTFAASAYVAMMALIYAKVLASQSELEHESRQHLATAAELRKATEEAERAANAKAAFLARMSHELRTPLNAVIGYSQVLIEEGADRGDPEAAEDLSRIHAAGQHLLRLVNNILELSRIEAKKAELTCAPTDLPALIAATVQELQPEAERRENTMSIEIAGDADGFRCDAGKVRQIVEQLLKNAVKFTRKGTIHLAVSVTGDRPRREVAVQVRDTGIGIEAERLSRVFEHFTGGGDRTGGEYDGSGLGLALARNLAQLMRGDIRVRSEVGQGSTFIVTLPEHAEKPSAAPRVERSLTPAMAH